MTKKDYEVLYKVIAEKNARGNIIDDYIQEVSRGNWKVYQPMWPRFKDEVLKLVSDSMYNEREVERLEEELEEQEEKYSNLQIDIKDIVDNIHLLGIDEEDKEEFDKLVDKLYRLAK